MMNCNIFPVKNRNTFSSSWSFFSHFSRSEFLVNSNVPHFQRQCYNCTLWANCPVQRNGVKIVKSQRSIFQVQAKVKTVNYSRLSTTWKISIIYFNQPSEKKTFLNFPQLSSSSRAGDEHSPRCFLLGVHDHYVFWCFCQKSYHSSIC